MSLYPVAKAQFFYLESNIRRLVNGPIEVIFPEITSEDHGILIAASDISKALAELHTAARNIYDAIECLNTVNELVEATNRKGNITIPHYEADLSGLVLSYGRFGDVEIQSIIAGNELRRSIKINTDGWGFESSHDGIIKAGLLDKGFNISGLDDNRSLVIDLGCNPQNTIPICTLADVFDAHTQSPTIAIRIFSEYLTPILKIIREHFEVEAAAMRELSGEVSGAQPLGPVSGGELGKVKE